MKKKTHVAGENFKPVLPDSLKAKINDFRKLHDSDDTKKLIKILSREDVTDIITSYRMINEYGKRNSEILQYLRDLQLPLKNIQKELTKFKKLKVLTEGASEDIMRRVVYSLDIYDDIVIVGYILSEFFHLPRSGSKDRAIAFLLAAFKDMFTDRKLKPDYKLISGFMIDQNILDTTPADIQGRMERIRIEDTNIGYVIAMLGMFSCIGYHSNKREEMYELLKERNFTITKSK